MSETHTNKLYDLLNAIISKIQYCSGKFPSSPASDSVVRWVHNTTTDENELQDSLVSINDAGELSLQNTLNVNKNNSTSGTWKLRDNYQNTDIITYSKSTKASSFNGNATTATTATDAVNSTYSSHIGTNSSHPAIGNSSTPVYVNSSGVVTACTDTQYHKGDQLRITGQYIIATGYITSSAKGVVFYIPLSKPIASDVTSINISGNTTVRTCKGYLNGTSGTVTYDSLGEITTYRTSLGITVVIVSDTAHTNVDNNTPIAVQLHYGTTITFN